MHRPIESIPEKWRWFPQSRFGLFVHWGAYSAYGRGEQVLFREHLDQREYGQAACQWNPRHYDARAWAADRLWGGDPRRMTAWARARGDSVQADGN